MANLDELLAEETPAKRASLDDLLAEPSSHPVVSNPSPAAKPANDEGWWKRGMQQGFGDTVHGPAQLMQNILPDSVMNVARKAGASIASAAGAPSELVSSMEQPRTTEEFNALEREREGAYQAERKGAGKEGMDWWRVAGALSNPVGWMTPSSEAATLVQGIKAGAKIGAFQSLLQPVATEGNYLWDKGMQAAVGGLVGGGLSGALTLLQPALRYGAGTLKKMMGTGATDAAIDQAADTVTANVTKTAVGNSAKIDPNLYSAIRQEVGDAMRAGVDPSAEVIARRADAGALPVPVHMTRAQLTRDPMAWAWEHRVSGQRGVGEPLSDLLSGQNKALVENLNALGAKAAPSPYAASEQVITRLNAVDEQLRSRINDAYSKVRNSAGRPAMVDSKAFAEAAQNALTDGQPELAHLVNRGDFLPASIQAQFNDIVQGKIPLTVDNMQFFDRAWNAAQRAAPDDQAAAIWKLRKALNETPVADSLGQESMALYKQARQMAAQRFGLIDSNPAYKAAVAGKVEPDKFFQKYVEGANVSELKGLKQLVGPEITTSLQNTFIAELKRKALSNASDEAGTFSQAAYNRVMQDPVRMPRINELFADNTKTLDQLYRVGRVAEGLIKPPAVARVNTSNTAVESANIVRDIAKSETGGFLTSLMPNWVQGLGRVMGDASERVKESKAVHEAINPGVTAAPLPRPRQPEGTQRLSDLLARGAGASVAAEQRDEERE